jgi:hypothetical protein
MARTSIPIEQVKVGDILDGMDGGATVTRTLESNGYVTLEHRRARTRKTERTQAYRGAHVFVQRTNPRNTMRRNGSTLSPGYKAIKAEADRLKMPVAYRDDLIKHDKASLKDYNGRFIWILRDYGTHLLLEKQGPSDWTNSIKAMEQAAANSGTVGVYYWSKLGGLRKIPATKIREIATKELGWSDARGNPRLKREKSVQDFPFTHRPVQPRALTTYHHPQTGEEIPNFEGHFMHDGRVMKRKREGDEYSYTATPYSMNLTGQIRRAKWNPKARPLGKLDSLGWMMAQRKNYTNDADYYRAVLKAVQDGVISPSAVVGSGYKNARTVAINWIKHSIEHAESTKRRNPKTRRNSGNVHPTLEEYLVRRQMQRGWSVAKTAASVAADFNGTTNVFMGTEPINVSADQLKNALWQRIIEFHNASRVRPEIKNTAFHLGMTSDHYKLTKADQRQLRLHLGLPERDRTPNPRKLSREDFDKRYWNSKTEPLPPASTRREFYADYVNSGLSFTEYKRQTETRYDW